jgi:hypothetical protein
MPVGKCNNPNFGKTVVGHRFKKGESGNPGGTPAVHKEIKEARKFNMETITKIVNSLNDKTTTELEAISKDKSTDNLTMLLVRIILKAQQTGDYKCMEFLITHLIGKPKQQVEVSGMNNIAIDHNVEKHILDAVLKLNSLKNGKPE